MSQQKTVLRRLRREREISIAQLSHEIGINTSKLSIGERGMCSFSDDEQDRLARYFGVSKEKLFSPAEAVAS